MPPYKETSFRVSRVSRRGESWQSAATPGPTRTDVPIARQSRYRLAREPSATCRKKGFEQIQDWCDALRVEPGRGRRDANPDGKRIRRERSEQRLIRPIVADREDEVPRFP